VLLSGDVAALGLAAGMGSAQNAMAASDPYLQHDTVQISDAGVSRGDAFQASDNSGPESSIFDGVVAEDLAPVTGDSSAGDAQNAAPVSTQNEETQEAPAAGHTSQGTIAAPETETTGVRETASPYTNFSTTESITTLRSAQGPPANNVDSQSLVIDSNLSNSGDGNSLPVSTSLNSSNPTGDGSADYLLSAGTPANSSSQTLDPSKLEAIVAYAIQRCRDSGLLPLGATDLDTIKFAIVDLTGSELGQTLGGTIQIDSTAAGFGWFVDSTPEDNNEFGGTLDGSSLEANAGGEAEGRIDLLTVVLHELGHVAGFSHDSGLELMEPVLPAGERVLLADSGVTANQTPDQPSTDGNQVTVVDPVVFGGVTFQPGTETERGDLEALLSTSVGTNSLTFNATVEVDGFVHLTGTFTITRAGTQTVDIATGLPANAVDLLGMYGSTISDASVSVWTFTATNVQAFVGLNGPYQTDSDGNGVIEGAELTDINPDAAGLAITNLNVAAVLMVPVLVPTMPLYALKATATSAQLVGMGDVATASATNILVEVNSGVKWPGGFGPPVVDFASSFSGDGSYVVGNQDFIDLNGNYRVGAAADSVELGLANFVYVIGSFSFEKGPTNKVEVATGLPANLGGTLATLFGGLTAFPSDITAVTAMSDLSAITQASLTAFANAQSPALPLTTAQEIQDALTAFAATELYVDADFSTIHNLEVDSLQIGFNGAHVFVGLNGPYQSDTNHDGVVDNNDAAPNPDAAGLAIDNVDFGFLLAEPTLNALPGFSSVLPKFYALKATAATAGLVGMDSVLTASLENILVEVNNSSGWPGGLGPPVINFQNSFGTDEVLSFFDYDGSGAITVADLRDADKGNVSSVSGLYDGATDGTTVVSSQELVAALDGLGNGDGQLQLTEVSAFGDGAGAITASGADADGDGKLDPPGYEVRTGTSTAPVYLTFDGNQRIGAAADEVLLQLADFVHIQGSFSFEKGPTNKVEVATGLSSAVAATLSYLFNDLIPATVTAVNDVSSDGLQALYDAGLLTNDPSVTLPSLSDLQSAIATWKNDGNLYVSPDFFTIYNVEVDSLQIGTSNAHAFVGLHGPYWTDLDGDGAISWALPSGQTFDTDVMINSVTYHAGDPTDGITLTNTDRTPMPTVTVNGVQYGDLNGNGKVDPGETAELNSKAVGLSVDGVDFGFVTMAPTLASLPGLGSILPKFTALKATADQVSFVGIDEIVASIESLEIDVNNGTEWPGGEGPPVIDFSASFATDEVAAFFDVNNDGVTVSDLRTLAGQGLNGAWAGLYDAGTPGTLLLSSTDIIAALGGSDGQLQLSELSAFGAGAGGITASGADSDGDGKLDPPGFEVRTGTSTAPVYLDYDGNQRIGASAERVTIQLSQFVYVTGSVAFEKGPFHDVSVTGGLLSSLGSGAGAYLQSLGLPSDLVNSYPVLGGQTVSLGFMTIGASNVHAFVGMKGPYWVEDLDGDGNISWALPSGQTFETQVTINNVTYHVGDPTDGITLTNTDGSPMPTVTVNGVEYGDLNGDGKVDANETPELNPDAVGLVLNNFDFGLAIMASGNPLDFAKYYALKASADTISLVGMDNVTLNANSILVEVNQSTPSIFGVPLFPVVDFANTPEFASEELPLFDTNHDGTITLGELATLNSDHAAGFAALNSVALDDPTPVDHEMLLGILNTDHTGASHGVIDITEAAALLGGDNAAVTAAQNADVDGDGKIDPLGYELNTGGDPVYLDMDSSLIRAQGFVELNLFNTVYLTGSIAFELGPTQDVTLTNSVTKTVTTMTIGAANVTAFIGANGPYWTDTNGDHSVSSDELSASAIGFDITDLDVGIAVMASTDPIDLGVYLAAKASVNQFGVVGIDYLTATGTFDIAINVGIGASSGTAVVDFQASFPDTDGNGPDKTGFEVNTGDPTSPVVLDFDQFLISVQLGGIVTVYSDSMQTNPVLRLNGLFLFEADNSGLKAFVAAGLEFGPDIGSGSKFFDMNALGGLVINSQGIAADIDVSVSIGPALGDLSLDVGAEARLIFNTTGSDQTITIPQRYVVFLDGTVDLSSSELGSALTTQGGADVTALSSLAGTLDARFTLNQDGSVTFTIFGTAPTMASLFPDASLPSGGLLSDSGPYFAVAISAHLYISGDWGLDGRFGLIVSGSGFQLSVEANLLLGPVGSLSATGDVIIDNTGLRARVAVNGTLGSSTIGLEIGASGYFEVNTTSNPWVIDSSTTVDPGLRVGVSAHFDFLSFAQGDGTAVVVFENNDFQLVIDGNLTIGNAITFDIFAYVGIFSDGVVVDIDASLVLDNVLNLLDLNLSGRLQINTTGTSRSTYTGAIFDNNGNITGFGMLHFVDSDGKNTTILAHSFKLDLQGSLVLLDNLTISGRLIIAVQNDAWSITVPSSNPLSVNVFNVFTIDIWGYINSDGSFDLNLSGSVDFTLAGNGIQGTISLHVWLDTDLNPDFGFTASGSVGAYLGGTELAGASVSLSASGNLGDSVSISLTVSGTGTVIKYIEGALSWLASAIWGHKVDVSLSFTMKLGTIKLPGSLVSAPPPPLLLAGQSDGSAWSSTSSGTLYLNVGAAGEGDRAKYRNESPGETQEDYTITRLASGEVRIAAFGKTEDFANVTRIEGNFGSDADSVAFINIGAIDVDVSGGAGNDSMSYSGSGTAILRGDANEDNLTIDGTPKTGSALYGGSQNDTLFNACAADVALYGEDGNDNITGGTGSDTTLNGGSGNDRIEGRAGLDNAVGGSGADTFVEELANLVTSETFDGNGGTEDQLILVGTTSAQDFRVTIDNSNVVTVHSYNASHVETGSVIIANVELVNLSGEGGADAFTVTGELNLGGVTDVVMDMGSVTSSTTPPTHTPDGARDQVNITLTSNADTLGLATVDMGIQGIWKDHFNYDILMGYSSDGDAIVVNAGGGNDIITVGDTDPSNAVVGLNGFSAYLTVNGEGDSDTLNVDDSEDLGGNNGTLTSTMVTGLGMTGQITYATLETVNVNLGLGGDTFNVQSTSVLTTVNTGTGSSANTVKVGSLAPFTGGNVNSIAAKLVVNGESSGNDTLNVDDTGDSTSNDGTLTSSRITGLGMGGGDTTKGIQYSGVDTLNINLGTGGDILNVQSTSALTTVRTGTGIADDTVNVGSLAPSTGGNVNSLAGKLAVTGESTGNETLNVDDTGDRGPNVGTLTSTRLTGLGMAGNDSSKGIEYTGFNALNIGLGSNADTLTVESTHAGATTIDANNGDDIVNLRTISGQTTVNGSIGSDTFNVGSNAAGASGDANNNTGGNVNSISAALTLNGNDPTSGSDVLNVDDSGDMADNTGTLTSTQITGLGMSGSITYGTVEHLNIYFGSGVDTFIVQSTHTGKTDLYGNDSGDIFNVRTISGTTTINSGDGADTINVGSNAQGNSSVPDNNSDGTVNSISALLTLNGGGTGTDRDLVTVDDTADMVANTGILTSNSLTGLGMGNADQSVVEPTLGIRYSAMEDLVISLGSGADTFTINGTHNRATGSTTEATTLKAGAGNDVIHIYDASDMLTVYGEADTDTVNVYGTGAGSNTILNGQDGGDVFNVQAMAGDVTVNGGENDDTVNVGSMAPTHPSLPTAEQGNIDAINGLLTVNGGSGTSDVLNVDDSDPFTRNKTGTLTNSTIRGLELEEGVDYSNLDELNIWLALGDNTFVINSTHAGETTVNTAEGKDTVNINDASGLLTINAEEGDDTINVRATSLNSEVRINGQLGNDTINLSDQSPTLPAAYPATLPPAAADTVGSIDGIDGLVVIDGGTEFDVVNVDDSHNTTAKAGTLTQNTLRGLAMPAGINYTNLEDLNLWLGTGADVLFIDSTHGGTTQVYAGDGNATTNERDDTIGIKTIAGVTTIHGQAGNDFIEVNVDAPVLPEDAVFASLDPITGFFVRTHVNGLGAVLNLHGEGDSDQYTLNFAGQGNALVNVYDNGAPDNGADTLIINGADAVQDVINHPDDTFLLRKDFVALLNESVPAGGFDQVERANYDENINARLVVNGLGGNDKIVVDDNSSITTLDGGNGDDTFQIGQVFGLPRDEAAGVAPEDTFATTPIIIGVITDPETGDVIFDPTSFDPTVDVLPQATIDDINAAIDYRATHGGGALDGIAYVSHGVSQATTIFGGDGKDTFNVYHNKGTLRLEGEAGNETFVVRAFVTVDLSSQGDTEINGGGGADTINYAINAPVNIDGGDGFDKVVVLGTPFNDNFVVTSDGIFGAGLNVTFDNVESAELDTLEGNDTIYILGTNAEVVTTVIGGLGRDSINVMGDVQSTIISNDLMGVAGVISQGLTSDDPAYDNVGVNGVDVTVVSATGDSLVNITPTGEPLLVTEDGTTASYFISLVNPDLTALGDNPVFLTVSAGLVSTSDLSNGGASIRMRVKNSGKPFTNAVVLTFDGSTGANTFEIEVEAIDDTAAEGPRVALISHSINSNDPTYNDLPLIDVFVNVVDNDQPGLDVRQLRETSPNVYLADSSTEVLEGNDVYGLKDFYSVALTTAPATGETVTVTLQTDNQVTATSQLTGLSVLTFTDSNWMTPQVVLVKAVDDSAIDGVTHSTITHLVQSDGSVYSGFPSDEYPTLDVTAYDNETSGAIVQETGGSTVVVDGGANDTYRVRLTRMPDAPVVLTLRTDTETFLSSLSGSFAVVDDTGKLGYYEYTYTIGTDHWSDWVNITVSANPSPLVPKTNVKTFAPQDQNLDQIAGPLNIEGGAGPDNTTRAIAEPVMLPGEVNDVSGQNNPSFNESDDIDTLNVFHTDNSDADIGALSYRMMDVNSKDIANPGLALTGFEMGGDIAVEEGTTASPMTVYYGGGITYNGFEIVEVLLGKGNETLTVNDTGDRDAKNPDITDDPATITAIHGGGGDDTITINERGNGPLVVYGDTSEDGVRYSNNEPSGSINGTTFNNPGKDTIDASALAAKNDGFVGVVIYGGPGKDTITGSQDDDQLAGGEGPDTIYGEAGNDNIYGDSHFNVNLQLFAQDQINRFDSATQLDDINAMFTVPTSGVGDGDTIHGGAGDDVLFGDHGIIDQVDGTRRIETTGNLVRLQTTNLANGGGDTIDGDDGNDFIFGGTAGDTIYGDLGSDLIFGDFGTVAGNVDASMIGEIDGAGVQNSNAVFTYTSDTTGDADASAGNDTIYGGSAAALDTDTGKNILLGQQGSDTIYGGGGDDDIYGGHDVANGTDTGDFIDGEAGNDVILGDNGLIERTAAANDPRFTVLTGTQIYGSDGEVMVADSNSVGANPAGVEARRIELFDHNDSSTANLGNFGDDVIAGGADDDVIFGELGGDTIHGDGLLEGTELHALIETIAGSDVGGDDYIEGNGGGDTIYGGLGQDDIVGGSSSLYNLTDPAMRPDGSDTIFGGNGDMTDRNTYGDGSHARDSDMILGDNGNIYRLVGTGGVDTGSLLSFNYDNYAALRIVVRAAELLDYTPGGTDYSGDAANDIGAGDTIRGESGDDFIYGQKGDDVIFGDAQDDDIIAGYGNDWISGGTGDDGVIGDDGRIYTSRNGTAEPLNGVTATAQDSISTPGGFQQAITDPTGQLKKAVDLTPFSQEPNWLANADEFGGVSTHHSDDIIYGGLGNDWLHGASGDDAISGAEALPVFYATPSNPGNVLGYDPATGTFAKYDEYSPMEKIDGFVLNFDASEGPDVTDTTWGTVHTDGEDKIFGDLGNDWLVGGTGRDDLYGGWGEDLMNADDNQDTNGSINDQPDTHPSYEDRVYGGAGRDVLIANTGGDRLIDWAGEFNSYLVPFAPFGLGTVSRTLQPQLAEFLYALSASDGADFTRAADTSADPARNGEPFGELGVVRQQDFAWQDQTGAPRDIQPGNIPGGKRDVLRSASFDGPQATTAGGFSTASGFSPDSGSWTVQNGALQVAAASLGGDAVSVFEIGDALPGYFEVQASVMAVKPTGGWNANSLIIFDYQSKDDFKFAGIDVSTNKLVMGHRDASGWQVDEQSSFKSGLKSDTYYNLLLAVNGVNATLVVNNQTVFTHTYEPRVVDGYSYGLNWGMVGVGSNNARGTFDNIQVQILPPEYTYQDTEDFSGGATNLFTGAETGFWQLENGGLSGTADTGSDTALNLVNLGLSGGLAPNSILNLSATLNTQSLAGFVFDAYSLDDFKFVVINAETQQITIGHHTAKRGWLTDASLAYSIEAGRDYDLGISLQGSTVSVTLDGQVALGYAYNAVTVDGGFGLLTGSDSSWFDTFTVMTDDPALLR
jgi:Ca2+-binding RTX toxin-like protein/Ca2+-binding EF-hand superfamily protein